MTEHISISGPQVSVFIRPQAGHFIDHRAFQMHHLIMGQRQNIIFSTVVAHGKGHGIMIVFTEIGIQLHVFTEIMHPAHIPLKAEVQAAFINRPRHHRPGC